jgi:hypothetical protein
MSHAAEFALTAPPQPIAPDNQLVIGFMLTNRFEREMYFNTRFAVVPSVGDVWPTLIGPSGNPVPYALRVRMAPLHASDFLLLKPNESVLAGAALRKLFRLTEPGVYKLSAKYVSNEVPPELKDRLVFVGELESKPVSFTI